MKRLAAFGALAACAALSQPAEASSMPRADFEPGVNLGAGLGVSQTYQGAGGLSIDLPAMPDLLVGASLGAGLAGNLNYDARVAYRLVEGGTAGPTIAAIGGLWGATGSNAFQLAMGVAPFVGFGLAYPATERIDLRLNLAYSPFYRYGGESLVFIGGPPAAGVEVGYRLSPTVEATLGLNGRGDVLGLKVAF